jgi:hypothetical protein
VLRDLVSASVNNFQPGLRTEPIGAGRSGQGLAIQRTTPGRVSWSGAAHFGKKSVVLFPIEKIGSLILLALTGLWRSLFPNGNIRATWGRPVSGRLYATDTITDQLLTIDLATGAATTDHSLGLDGILEFAFHPETGVLYGVDVFTNDLITIDLATGAGHAVGRVGLGAIAALAFVRGPEPSSATMIGCVARLLAATYRRTDRGHSWQS